MNYLSEQQATRKNYRRIFSPEPLPLEQRLVLAKENMLACALQTMKLSRKRN